MNRFLTPLFITLLTASCYAESAPQHHPGADEFAQQAEEEYQIPAADVQALLEKAQFVQSIVDAISRPAESKPWYQYRPIFVTDERIEAGVEFWQEHQERIATAAERYQVDPQVIVAIIGVETYYGRITGSYRVIDALATLAFYYPKNLRDRSDFFSRELMQFLVLGQEEGIPTTEVTGSYAGAMGLGQFMPSSYREYAVDLDGDGRRDLWSSMDDIVGSVANYLHRHGWQYGEPIVVDAEQLEGADASLIAERNFKPETTVSVLAENGFVTDADIPPEVPAVVLGLEERNGERLWLTFDNFYVITRYNRSPLYAMAVYELSEAIRQGMEQ
jgi:membrane-bound lytic murein transglycosylase B